MFLIFKGILYPQLALVHNYRNTKIHFPHQKSLFLEIPVFVCTKTKQTSAPKGIYPELTTAPKGVYQEQIFAIKAVYLEQTSAPKPVYPIQI
jgi:hypothetical protein